MMKNRFASSRGNTRTILWVLACFIIFLRKRCFGYFFFRLKYRIMRRQDKYSIEREKDRLYYIYRDRYIKAGLIQRDCKTIDEFPKLNKSSIKASYDNLVLESPLSYISKTSGSTGTPFHWKLSYSDLNKRLALLDLWKEELGLPFGSRRATFTGNLLFHENYQGDVYWRQDYLMRELRFSTYHMSSDNLRLYWNKLSKYRPHYIEGYPSAIGILARWVIDSGEKLSWKLKVVITTAENLSDDLRQTIRCAFNTDVVQYYGSSDGAPIIAECTFGGLHLIRESGWFSLRNKVANNGFITGNVFVTSSISTLQPVVNYEVGDSFTIPKGRQICNCGKSIDVISIDGRKDDYLTNRHGAKIGRVSQSAKYLPKEIVAAQIIQKSQLLIRVMVQLNDVSDKECDRLDFNEFEKDLEKRLNQELHFEYVFTKNIAKDANGKFKYVVSEIND